MGPSRGFASAADGDRQGEDGEHDERAARLPHGSTPRFGGGGASERERSRSVAGAGDPTASCPPCACLATAFAASAALRRVTHARARPRPARRATASARVGRRGPPARPRAPRPGRRRTRCGMLAGQRRPTPRAPAAGQRPRARRARAVQAEDRALRARVEVREHRLGAARRQQPARDRRDRQSHGRLAHDRPAPQPRDPVPAVAGQEGHDVDRDQPDDPLGGPLRQRQPDAAPVVHDEAEALEAGELAEALEPVGVAADRVREVAALGRPAESRQVGRDPAAALEERRPQLAVVRHAVQPQHRRVPGPPPRDRQPVELVFAHLDHGRIVPRVPPLPRRDWTPPTRRRVRALRDRLRLVYGRPVAAPHRRPLDELILTVLSQSTNDRNRDVAFLRLRARFPSWEAVREAPLDEVEAAIRPGGISKVKSERIQAILRELLRPALARPPGGRDRRQPRGRSSKRCPASAARRPPACCCSASACATCRSTRTSRASARGSGCSAPARRSPSSTTTCWPSPRAARSSSSTSTCCATGAGPATRSGRRAPSARCAGCARRRLSTFAPGGARRNPSPPTSS